MGWGSNFGCLGVQLGVNGGFYGTNVGYEVVVATVEGGEGDGEFPEFID